MYAMANYAHSAALHELFPAQEIQDPAGLDLIIHKREQISSEQQPNRTLTRIELEFTSFVWEGETWRHRAFVYLPDMASELYSGAGVIVSSRKPDDPVYMRYAESAALMGIPALMIRDGNPGPRYGQTVEGEVMGYGAKRFNQTGDYRWHGFAWLGRVMMRAITAAQQVPGFEAERFVVTGCSKRGMASWISSAADERVVGAFPTCWNAGNFAEFFQLKAERWGLDHSPKLQPGEMGEVAKNVKITNAPAFLTPRQQLKIFANHPMAKKAAQIQDPYQYRDLLKGKKVLYSSGVNDPLFHVASDTLFLPHMPEGVRVQLVANDRHTSASEEQHIAWPMFLAHVFVDRPLTEITSVSHKLKNEALVVNVTIDSQHTVEQARLWFAGDEKGAYIDAEWRSVVLTSVGEGEYQAKLPLNTQYIGYFVEIEDRGSDAMAGLITSGFQEFRP
jgi:PhoPQ-activated pathogenicity-related protein